VTGWRDHYINTETSMDGENVTKVVDSFFRFLARLDDGQRRDIEARYAADPRGSWCRAMTSAHKVGRFPGPVLSIGRRAKRVVAKALSVGLPRALPAKSTACAQGIF
jgi:hypothetical protein